MNGLDPDGAAPRRHGHQAADRRARARARVAARAAPRGVAGRRARTPTPGASTPADIAAVAAANGVPPLARLRDRLAGERLQQRHGLHRQRARRHAGHAGHVGLGPAEPRATRSSTRLCAIDNVRAGVLYLGTCCATPAATALAAAGYYQGLGSVRSIGMLPETQQYVDNVMALRSRFGG